MKHIFLLCFLFITSILFGQKEGNDIIYLKNGSVIKGIITGKTDSTFSVSTSNGSIFVYNNREIQNTVIDKRNASPKHSRGSNLWVGFNLEPEFQDIVRNKRQYEIYKSRYPQNDYKHVGQAGFLGGFSLYYQVRTVGFETGLQYHFYQNKETSTLSFPNYYGGGNSYVYNIANQFHSIEIPVLINLHSNGDKVRFYSSDGLVAGVMLGSRHSAGYTPGRDTVFTHGVDSATNFYCMLVLSAGVQLTVSENMAINWGLVLRISSSTTFGALNPFYTGGYTFVPYSIGLNMIVLFRTGADKNKYRRVPARLGEGLPGERL